jgi:SPP1 family predicted phage head-tail adaptor
MSLSAGRLRHRITIQQLVTTGQDPTTGELNQEWQDLHTSVPAAIEPLSAREFMASQAVQSKYSARIVIRYRAGLDPAMRIVGVCGCHEGRIFNPAGWLADPDSGLEYLTAPCTEGVDQG